MKTHLLCSSFYGLLDILSGTELNTGQKEIGECPDAPVKSWSLTFFCSDNSEAVLRAITQGLSELMRLDP